MTKEKEKNKESENESDNSNESDEDDEDEDEYEVIDTKDVEQCCVFLHKEATHLVKRLELIHKVGGMNLSPSILYLVENTYFTR